jgi:hypothetical protein
MSFVRVAVLRQHAEDARYFVAAAITPKGSARRDNKVGVTTGNPKMGRAIIFREMTALLSFGCRNWLRGDRYLIENGGPFFSGSGSVSLLVEGVAGDQREGQGGF